MIRPELLAVEGQRPCRKRDARNVLEGRLAVLPRHASDPVIRRALVFRRDQIELAADIRLATDLMRRRNRLRDVSAFVDAEQTPVVPLTDEQPRAVEAQLRAGIIRTAKALAAGEAALRQKPPHVAVVVVSFAANR